MVVIARVAIVRGTEVLPCPGESSRRRLVSEHPRHSTRGRIARRVQGYELLQNQLADEIASKVFSLILRRLYAGAARGLLGYARDEPIELTASSGNVRQLVCKHKDRVVIGGQ